MAKEPYHINVTTEDIRLLLEGGSFVLETVDGEYTVVLTIEQKKPLTPRQSIDEIAQSRAHLQNQTIHYINSVLSLAENKVLLADGKPVAIYDSSDSLIWREFAPIAIEAFRGEGWQIDPDPEHSGGYLFKRVS